MSEDPILRQDRENVCDVITDVDTDTVENSREKVEIEPEIELPMVVKAATVAVDTNLIDNDVAVKKSYKSLEPTTRSTRSDEQTARTTRTNGRTTRSALSLGTLDAPVSPVSEKVDVKNSDITIPLKFLS